jgi:hypothetical protein
VSTLRILSETVASKPLSTAWRGVAEGRGEARPTRCVAEPPTVNRCNFSNRVAQEPSPRRGEGAADGRGEVPAERGGATK